MNQVFPVRAVAGAFALAAFGVAIVSGLAADRDASDILSTALLALFLGQLVGTLGGYVLSKAIDENLRAYRKAHPYPVPHQPAPDAGAAAARGGTP